MQKNSTNLIALSLFLLLLCGLSGILPACAQKESASPIVTATTPESDPQKAPSAQESRTRLISRADQEIDRRIQSLNALKLRIQAMKKISNGTKSDLSSTIQDQVTALTDLQSGIDTETDLDALRSDVQSITKSYRVYALVIPQGTVLAAADRVLTLADSMDKLAAKLDARLSAAETSGQEVSQARGVLSDMQGQIADARLKAQATSDAVSQLTPDNGDAAKMQSNLTALKDARTQIKNAHGELRGCRQDANDIIGVLKELGTQK